MTDLSAPVREFDLSSRYGAAEGPALVTGIQALVRLLLTQRRLDERRGLNTAAFITGYPGSPLGGLDREIARQARSLEPLHIGFDPGLNEELAATAIGGTQLVPELPGRRFDGVTGFWYGKAPGLDRAADAIRHANTSGTSHLGGAVALIGDDPMCKSSTLPSSCELMAESLVLPLFAPGRVGDIVRLGLHAVAMSRATGMWTALKITSDVADATAGIRLDDHVDEIPLPPAASRGGPPTLLGMSSVVAEHDLMTARTQKAREYGRRHKLNRVLFEPLTPRVAIVAPGPAYAALERALGRLDLDEAGLEALGARLVRLDLVWPLHEDDVIDFTAGVSDVVVVEDKRPFVERQLRDILYGRATAPRVLGKHDAGGRPLISGQGMVDSDGLARALARFWGDELPAAAAERMRETTERVKLGAGAPLPMARTAFFCSGCPHNLSTRAPAERLVGAGIGCHSLVAVDPLGSRGRLIGAPQMGGEGAQWTGMAPFTDDAHYVQNMGDGTFHHSGSLAIRAAVASGSHMTFRILYNDAIAMTGGQPAPGRIDVPELTRWLQLEGVARVVITTEEPASFAGAQLSEITTVRPREELQQVQDELAAVAGVTVVVHTDRCATEERRLRKRGKLAQPATRAWINERVCEGCGDCGAKSSCLSVVPTDTELGRKTQIHQGSCTQDLACLEGDCPSFIVVTPGRGAPARGLPAPPLTPGDPVLRVDPGASTLIRVPGIGGTGVVTLSQILQAAALLEGKSTSALDQTGLAQKGGAVTSDIRIAPRELGGSPRAAGGEVDVLLGLDLLGAVAPDTIRSLDPRRTVAVVNLDITPTAALVTDVAAEPPATSALVAQLERFTSAAANLWLDAGTLAEEVFGDHMPTNMIMLGAAYQHGCIPLHGDSIEQAIRLNGAAVESNLAAFSWGRAAAADPTALAAARAALAPPSPAPAIPAFVTTAVRDLGLEGALAEAATLRAADLCGYQDKRYALRYLDDVAGVLRRERAAQPDSHDAPVALAFARGLHKLMAYKDEYEVARLHRDAVERARLERAFGDDAEVAVLVHPPLLRALGLRRKLKLKRSAPPLFAALHAARRLRGTALDPFGRSAIRRLERELVEEYRTWIELALTRLEPGTAASVAELAALPDLVRGYEEIKVGNVERYRLRAAELLGDLGPA